jgi:membrane dipeptidase
MKIVLKLMIAVIVSGYAMLASGQSESLQLSGEVKDIVSGEYLADVSVSITNLNTGTVDTVKTNSSGYWDFTLVSKIDKKEILPSNFYVSSPYPNPFNPKTKIDFYLPFRGPIKITVYNILGEVVDSKDSDLNVGVYSIDWEGTGAAGIYFINIRTNKSSITKKVTQLDGLSGSGLSDIHPGRQNINHYAKNIASTPIQMIISKFGYIADTLSAQIEMGEYFETVLSTIHSQLKLFDLHNDVLEMIYYNDPNYHLSDFHNDHHTDIPRLKLGGVDYQFFAIWVNPGDAGYYNSAIDMFNIFNREKSLNIVDLGQATTAAEALALNHDNKISAILAVEGGHVIENDLLKIDTLYNLGMRYLTITWNNSTDWAVSAQDERSALSSMYHMLVLKQLKTYCKQQIIQLLPRIRGQENYMIITEI